MELVKAPFLTWLSCLTSLRITPLPTNTSSPPRYLECAMATSKAPHAHSFVDGGVHKLMIGDTCAHIEFHTDNQAKMHRSLQRNVSRLVTDYSCVEIIVILDLFKEPCIQVVEPQKQFSKTLGVHHEHI
jgi:hypothetical protein